MASEGYVHGFEIDASHTLHIYQGSLVQVQADALVSSDDNYLSAGGGVSRALAQAAGQDIRREYAELVRQHRPALGDVVRTSAGALPCRYLYHAITIDFDHGTRMDESALRQLMANLLNQAAADGVQSLGLPALGTGAAWFDLDRAAEIIIDELLVRLVESPVQRVVLALIGDMAERLFYERMVRSRADRLTALALRRRETGSEDLTPDSPPATPTAPTRTPDDLAKSSETGERRELPADLSGERPAPTETAVGETIEQFPDLIDEARLAATASDRPRLVNGLADLILKHAQERDIEQELLSLPPCRGFRGTIKQRLMEFLYLSESHLKMALGPALFRNRDLRQMVQELGEDSDLPRDQDQLADTILRALCFNPLTPPVGMADYITRLDRLLGELRSRPGDERTINTAVVEAGKLLEQVLKDLLRLYASFFWGAHYEAELVRKHIIDPRRDGSPIMRLTIGQARQALEHLNGLVKKEAGLRAKWRTLGRATEDLLPHRLEGGEGGHGLDCHALLNEVIQIRNRSAHTGDVAVDPEEVTRNLTRLHAFFCACRESGTYPDVLRYEGTFENRNGERFVYFLDENGRERKVRTDEKIDPRRHYFCFATNNPVHLYPTLIPKL